MWKCLILLFKEDVNKRPRNFILFLNLNMVLRNSTPGGFTYFWQSMWVGIMAIKTKRTQIHFWSDVFAASASSDSKVRITEIWREDFIEPENWNQGRKALSKRGHFCIKIRLLQKRKRNWSRNAPATVCGRVTGDAPVCYWPIFFSVPSNNTRRLCESKLGSVFPPRF